MKFSKKQLIAVSIYLSSILAYTIESTWIRGWLFSALSIKENTIGFFVVILVPLMILIPLLSLIIYRLIRSIYPSQ